MTFCRSHCSHTRPATRPLRTLVTADSCNWRVTGFCTNDDIRFLVILARLIAAWMASSAVLMSSNSFSSSSFMALLTHQACAFCISTNADRIAFISKILKEIRLVLVWNIGVLQWLVSLTEYTVGLPRSARNCLKNSAGTKFNSCLGHFAVC